MGSAVLLLEITRNELKPEHFTAQLYISALDGLRELTRREPIGYGQQRVTLYVIESGDMTIGAVFDRPNGGEALLICTVRNGPTPHANRGDLIDLTNMVWP